ncbi:MAG: choice-of-anchor V domain-containing protein [Dissulfurispiraceae bacterium]|jgi:hypothetical protein|nr:choice-of-anchor V domain-containing protein [Dissulfurispiraceae bacterium]
MGKRQIMISFVLIAALVLFGVSVSSGHNNSGANFECMGCHIGGSGDVTIKIEGLPKVYTPGKLYKLTLIVDSKLKSDLEVQGGFGLQTDAGNFVVLDKKNTQIGDNAMLTHTKEGSEFRKWKFGWKAPAKGGDVNINVMAVAANGDFSPAGDEVGVNAFTIKSK